MKTPHGLHTLIVSTLESLGIDQGNFKLHLGKQIKGGTKKGVKFISFLPMGSGMLLKAQPSGKDGRHVCQLYFPEMFKDQLTQLADKLSQEVGQEELTDDEDVVKESQQEAEVGQEASSPDVFEIAATVAYSEDDFLSNEMLTLILSEIIDKKGFAWIKKGQLFEIIRKLELSIPSNVLIGRLFSKGYLEKDPDFPDTRSRLTKAAGSLVTCFAAPAKEVSTIDEETMNLALQILQLKKDAKSLELYSDEMKRIREESDKLKQQDARLEERLHRIMDAIGRRRHALKLSREQNESEEESLKKKLEPLEEANRKLQILAGIMPIK